MNLNAAAACGGRAESVPKRASFDLTNGTGILYKKKGLSGKMTWKRPNPAHQIAENAIANRSKT